MCSPRAADRECCGPLAACSGRKARFLWLAQPEGFHRNRETRPGPAAPFAYYADTTTGRRNSRTRCRREGPPAFVSPAAPEYRTLSTSRVQPDREAHRLECCSTGKTTIAKRVPRH